MPARLAGVTGARVWACFALLFLAAALPVLSVDLPPLLDYPNHLARMAVLADGGANADLARFYAIHWVPLPNLAMDLLVPPLLHGVPLMLAGRLFLLLLLAVTAAGPLLLSRALSGRWSYWPLAGFLLLYNRILLWGFVNFLFGVGLALWAAAFWVMLARRPVAQVVVAIAGVAAVFFCHIEAFGLLALILLGLEGAGLWQAVRGRRWALLAGTALRLAVPFLLPAAIVLAQWHPQAGHLDYARFWRKADLLFTVFDDYRRGFDVLCFALCLVLLLAGLIRGRIAVAWPLVPVLILVCLAYLAVPTTLYSGSAADRRVPVMIFLLLVAGLGAGRRPIASAAMARGLAIGFVLLLGARLSVVEMVWTRDQPIYRADLALLDRLPPGSRLAVASPPDTANVSALPVRHLPALAAASRQAFVSTLFTDPAQQPLLMRPDFRALAATVEPAALWSVLLAGHVPAGFDAVAMVDDRPVPAVAGPCLRLLGATEHLRLLEVTKNNDCH